MRSRSATPATELPPGGVRRLAVRRPILAYCVFTVGISIALMTALLIAGVSIIPAKVVMLVLLPGTAVLIAAWTGGAARVRQLFRGLVQWRIGVGRWLQVLLALPLLTLAVAVATDTFAAPPKGWLNVVGMYLLILVFSLVTANLLEEMAWTGLVQSTLMARHGLLRGSLLTAVPFCLVHLPLAYEEKGLAGTSLEDALLSWGLLLAALPFFRYLAGMLLVDTNGSVLAVAVVHASFNASGGMDVVRTGWQYVPAVIILTLLVAGYRALHGRPLDHPVGPASGHGVAAPAAAQSVRRR